MQEYTMTVEESKLLDRVINETCPYGKLSSPDSDEQKLESSRIFWRALGSRLGFDPKTVEPLEGDAGRRFRAEAVNKG